MVNNNRYTMFSENDRADLDMISKMIDNRVVELDNHYKSLLEIISLEPLVRSCSVAVRFGILCIYIESFDTHIFKYLVDYGIEFVPGIWIDNQYIQKNMLANLFWLYDLEYQLPEDFPVALECIAPYCYSNYLQKKLLDALDAIETSDPIMHTNIKKNIVFQIGMQDKYNLFFDRCVARGYFDSSTFCSRFTCSLRIIKYYVSIGITNFGVSTLTMCMLLENYESIEYLLDLLGIDYFMGINSENILYGLCNTSEECAAKVTDLFITKGVFDDRMVRYMNNDLVFYANHYLPGLEKKNSMILDLVNARKKRIDLDGMIGQMILIFYVQN